jgi:hypothetical protein
MNSSGTANWGNIGSGLFAEERNSIPSHVKKYEVFEINEDLLVLSVVWHRLRGSRDSHNVSSILDRELFDNIKQDDRNRAEQIRDYYSKKFTIWELNETTLTPFRKDLKEFIHSSGKVFKETMKPLVYRLPEFYDYDTDFDGLMANHNMQLNQVAPHAVVTKTLKFQKKLIKQSKLRGTVHEYWFADEHDNLNMLSIRKDNVLLKLLDLHVRQPIKVEAIYSKRTRDNKEYCTLQKYDFM